MVEYVKSAANATAGEGHVSFTADQMAIIRKYVASTPDGRIHDMKAANLPYAEFNGSMSRAEWDDLAAKLGGR